MTPKGRDFFKRGWDLALVHWPATAAYVAILAALGLLPAQPLPDSGFASVLYGMFQLALVFVPLWLTAGLAYVGMSVARGKEMPSLFAVDGGVVVKVVVGIIVQMVLVVFGFLLFVFPGMYLLLVWSLSMYAIVDGDGIYDALFHKSFRLAAGNIGLIGAVLSWCSLLFLPAFFISLYSVWTSGDFTATLPEPLATILNIGNSFATVVMVMASACLYVHLNDRRRGPAPAFPDDVAPVPV